MDIQIKVGRVKVGELRKGEWCEAASPRVRVLVAAARERQAARFARYANALDGTGLAGAHIRTNAEMSSREAQAAAQLTPQAEKFLETLDRSRISPRGYYRILKVARTVADLEAAECVSAKRLAEAFSYRLREEI